MSGGRRDALCIPSGPEAGLSGQGCQARLPLCWRWVFLRRRLSHLCKWTSAMPAPPALRTCPEISGPWLWLNPASCQIYLERNKPDRTAHINLTETCLTGQAEFPRWLKKSQGVLSPVPPTPKDPGGERKPEYILYKCISQRVKHNCICFFVLSYFF